MELRRARGVQDQLELLVPVERIMRTPHLGPINAIFFDWKHGPFWGGSSNHSEDYGIAW